MPFLSCHFLFVCHKKIIQLGGRQGQNKFDENRENLTTVKSRTRCPKTNLSAL